MVRVLVVNPLCGFSCRCENGVLWYAYPYFKQLEEWLRSDGHQVDYLEYSECVRDIFIRYVHDSEYVIGVGHGWYDRYTGYMLNILLRIGDPKTLFTGRKFLLLSCYTAGGLGQYAVRCGADMYFGWDSEYIVILEKCVRYRKVDDKYSLDYYFHMPVVEAFRRVVNGEDIGRVVTWLKSQFYKYANMFENSGDPVTALALRYDAKHICALLGKRHVETVEEEKKSRERESVLDKVAIGLGVGMLIAIPEIAIRLKEWLLKRRYR